MTLQAADVTKPLTSAGRITVKGHRLELDDGGAYIQHTASGNNKLHQKGSALIMTMKIIPPGDGMTCRDKEDAGVLGELGLNRLEEY